MRATTRKEHKEPKEATEQKEEGISQEDADSAAYTTLLLLDEYLIMADELSMERQMKFVFLFLFIEFFFSFFLLFFSKKKYLFIFSHSIGGTVQALCNVIKGDNEENNCI